jgi:hypothetical protein
MTALGAAERTPPMEETDEGSNDCAGQSTRRFGGDGRRPRPSRGEHRRRRAFVINGQAVAHFLFEDVTAARMALEAAGITVLEERDVPVNSKS